MSSKAHTQVAKPESSPQVGSRSNILQRQRTALLEPDDAKETAPTSYDEFRYSAPAPPSNPRLGHNFGRISVFPPARVAIQPKLKVSEPNDIYEQEADRVADTVMRMPEPLIQRKAPCPAGASSCEEEEPVVQTKPLAITPLVQRQEKSDEEETEKENTQTKPLAEQITPVVQRQTGEEEKEEKPEEEEPEKKQVEEESVQSKRSEGSTPAVPQRLEDHLDSMEGRGQPLPNHVRSFFEPRFGHDFSKVRVHADAHASNVARQLNAQAFTRGHDIVFGSGRFQPNTEEGRTLLAHELTHTIQQQAGRQSLVSSLQPAQSIVMSNEVRRPLPASRIVSPLAFNLLTTTGQTMISRQAENAPAAIAEIDPRDVADTPEDLVEWVVDKLQADPEDRSGEVGRRLTQLEPAQRAAVMARIQRRLSPKHFAQFTGSGAETAVLVREAAPPPERSTPEQTMGREPVLRPLTETPALAATPAGPKAGAPEVPVTAAERGPSTAPEAAPSAKTPTPAETAPAIESPLAPGKVEESPVMTATAGPPGEETAPAPTEGVAPAAPSITGAVPTAATEPAAETEVEPAAAAEKPVMVESPAASSVGAAEESAPGVSSPSTVSPPSLEPFVMFVVEKGELSLPETLVESDQFAVAQARDTVRTRLVMLEEYSAQRQAVLRGQTNLSLRRAAERTEAEKARIQAASAQTRDLILTKYSSAKRQTDELFTASRAGIESQIEQAHAQVIAIESSERGRLQDSSKAAIDRLKSSNTRYNDESAEIGAREASRSITQSEAMARNAIATGAVRAAAATGDEAVRGAKAQLLPKAAAKTAEQIRSVGSEAAKGARETAAKAQGAFGKESEKLIAEAGNATTLAESKFPIISGAVHSRLDLIQNNALLKLEERHREAMDGLDKSESVALRTVRRSETKLLKQLDQALNVNSSAIESQAQVVEARMAQQVKVLQDLIERETAPDPTAVDALASSAEQILDEHASAFVATLEEVSHKMEIAAAAAADAFVRGVSEARAAVEKQIRTLLSTIRKSLAAMAKILKGRLSVELAGYRKTLENAVASTQATFNELAGGMEKEVGRALIDLAGRIGAPVTEALGKNQAQLDALPAELTKIEKQVEKEANKGFWSKVWDAIVDIVKSVGFWIGVALIAAVIAVGVIFGGTAALIVGAILLAGFTLYTIGLRLHSLWKEDAPWYKYVIYLGAITLMPGLAILDALGIVGLIEGAVGYDLVTWRKLSEDEAAQRVANGIVSIILIIVTAGLGRVAPMRGAPRGAPKGRGGVEPPRAEPPRASPPGPEPPRPLPPGPEPPRALPPGPEPLYVNNNPRATVDEVRVGELLNNKAHSGELPGVTEVEGAAEIPGKRSGDYRFTHPDGSRTPADLYQPESGNPDSIALNIIEKSGQAQNVVVELGRGKSGQIGINEARNMARAVVDTPGHSIDRVVIIKNGTIIADESR